MVANLEEKKYLTPYVATLNVIGGNEIAVGRFMKQVEQLPVNIQGIIKNFSTAEFIEDKLAPQFNLNSQQVNYLTIAIKDLLLGELNGKNFAPHIQSSLGIGMETSQQIEAILSQKLFGPTVLPIEQKDFIAPEKPDLKMEPEINRNNVVDLRNK